MRAYTLLTKALFAKAGEAFAPVDLPHTWNAQDGQDGGSDFWRGIGTYQIDLPDPTAGKRQYIEIQGANHVATVYCNGRELGTHKGGFSTFRFELTDALQPTGNCLTVAVTNVFCDVYPQMADFTFHGGLYRDVRFVEVEDSHFDLMKHGSDAVFVTPRHNGNTRLDVFPVNAENCTVKVQIKDAQGSVVSSDQAPAQAHTVLHPDVERPHLWQGVEDPYCYSAEVTLCREEEVLDNVTVLFGYRSFRVDSETGFYLNGRSTPLRGVCRHQDRLDKGWALSKEDHKEDAQTILEIGANTIRLAHYQHDQYFYTLCDKLGFVLWAEIPFISRFMPGKDAYDNTISQMTELIAQCYNHPAICFWGISNEITIGGYTQELYKNLTDLNALCKRMDPSRLTTMAQIGTVPLNSDHIHITDVVSYNYYLGWYNGEIEDNGPRFDAFHAANPDICYGVSEYGVENIITWHSATPMCHDYTEEYANLYHHGLLKAISQRPYLWATHQWIMFDFGADARDEGGVKGRNNKGLVCMDHKTRKDAFYIYQAYWTKKPMVHVAGRRFADRAPGERDITIYTNADTVMLYVNGEKVGEQPVADHAAVFTDVPMTPGTNTITARTEQAEDTIILNAVEEHNTAYDMPELVEALQAGDWFEDQSGREEDDTIELREDFHNVEEPMETLLANPMCLRVVKGWFMSCDHMPTTEKMIVVSRLTNWQAMWGDRRLGDMNSVKAYMLPSDYAKLNRMLIKIKK